MPAHTIFRHLGQTIVVMRQVEGARIYFSTPAVTPDTAWQLIASQKNNARASSRKEEVK